MTVISISLRSETIRKQNDLINNIRSELYSLPVTLSDGFTVDADSQSIMNMQLILSAWRLNDSLYVGGINWKGSDNTFKLYSKNDFHHLVNEVISKVAIRRKAIFDVSEAWKLSLPLPDSHEIFNADNWSY